MTALDRVIAYHEGTKHRPNQYARSLGYLDWASQPAPFRAFDGSPRVPLHPAPGAAPLGDPPRSTYDALRGPSPPRPPSAMDLPALGFFLRHALGLSAWKVYGASRWSLRVNPSSGNLHPTEAYVIHRDRVWHYAPDAHAAEERCAFDPAAWDALELDPGQACLVALTSVHWREAWKYGERAFRYCQHDIGHAVGALALSAALCGWTLRVLAGWPHAALRAITGTDRPGDFVEAEPEDPACVMLVTASAADAVPPRACADFVAAVRDGRWRGRASQLSEDHVQWTFIDEVAEATAGAGDDAGGARASGRPPFVEPRPLERRPRPLDRGLDAAALLLQRRSAVALDGLSWIDPARFGRMMAATLPDTGAPFDALWWRPRVHLALFVHRVTGLAPGLYLLARDPEAPSRLRPALAERFAWTPVDADLPLWRLAEGDVRSIARHVSSDQAIAADGFFSAGLIVEFDGSLRHSGGEVYRQLFWETGVVGQVLYLEAEAAGARGTGIGCFFDDTVHQVLGVRDRTIQSLYHFTVGMPVEDRRLTTEPGYAWS